VSVRCIPSLVLALVFGLLLGITPGGARAQEADVPAAPAAADALAAGAPAAAPVAAPKPPPPQMVLPPDSWAGQLDLLDRWFSSKKSAATRCTDRCYTLERLVLSGSIESGVLDFELEGGVLADGPVAVPLFGPPSKVRVEHVTWNGKPVPVGFEADHYYAFLDARRFVLHGTLAMHGDLALTIMGPLDSLAADLSTGRVVEGPRLSGLAQTTIHFDAAKSDTARTEPTVFQLSRAVRIGREVNFEYRLVMRSGKDLGVARLPLPYGEKVLDVTGSSGWAIDGGDLVLPTAGNVAEMTVTGTLPSLGTFAADSRSPYEWWLLESDAEHRMTVTGDARQVDASQSPIARSQPTSRLFLVQKGQHVEVSVQALVSTEVLAAIVRSHSRMLVLTTRGDLVADDTLAYENNGIDYLTLSPQGREIYLSTDGRAERIMQQGATSQGSDVLVPLFAGSHSIHGQALSGAQVQTFGGSLELPVPTYPITASRVDVTVGLPPDVHAVALLGGDRAHWFVSWPDAVALVVGSLVAWLALRTGRRRILGAIVMGGLWCVSAPLYLLVVGALVAAGGTWLLGRLLPRRHFAGVATVLACACGLVFVSLAVATFETRKSSTISATGAATAAPQDVGVAQPGERALTHSSSADGDTATQVGGAVVQGVTPVALTLPSFDHTVSASRELVTRDRPFKPTLLYVTTAALLPLGAVWLIALALLVASHRAALVLLWHRVRARVAAGPSPALG
jgi:hypothetical protein